MKRLFLMAAMVFFVAMGTTVKAGPVDEQTAREIGAKYLSASVGMKTSVSAMQLAETYYTDKGATAFYIFSTEHGFVVVAAQDVAIPILGYSDEGPFDADNVPEQMQWWLNDYARQIEYGMEGDHILVDKTAHEWEMVKQTGRLNDTRDAEVVVSPLLGTIEWNQGIYYNNLCPEATAPSLGNHTYAGCVACAMSQIMRKWNHPATGTGSHTSTGKPTLTVDFSATTYDWDNMPVALTDGYGTTLLDGITEAQINAVATLMYHAGVAVNMRYGANGSSAYSDDVPTAFTNYFGYSDELELSKLNYTADGLVLWKVKLRSSLNHGYPMYYSGANGVSGHAFVCDGYNSDNYFHINWGYSGSQNGYFPIGALNYNPSSQYNAANDAVLNLHPNGTTTTFTVNVSANNDDYGTVEKTGTCAYGTDVTVTATPKSDYNFCYWSLDGLNVSENAAYTFAVKYDQDLVAVFAADYTITASSSNDTYGSVTGSGSYAYGASCTLTATPNEYYVFVNWTKGGDVVSTEMSYTFNVTGDGTYVANFTAMEGTHVGSGATTNSHFPITTAYKYSMSEQIYTHAQLGDVNVLLGSVAFFNSTASALTRDIVIYMKHTDKTTFSSTSDYICVEDSDKVFDGEVTVAASGWTIVDFDNYFEYNDGTKNVVLVVDDNTGTATTTLNFKVDASGLSYSAMYWNNDTDIDPSAPSTAKLGLAYRNELYIKTYDKSTKFSVTATVNPTGTGTVSGASSDLDFGTSCTLTATPETGYYFDNWKDENGKIVSKDISYTFNVRNDYNLVAHFRSVNDIGFTDDNVKALCVDNWDTDNDGELSYYEASQVASLGTVFKNNTTITSFDELQYFTRLTTIEGNAFNGCTNLTSVVLPADITSIGDYAFYKCTKLESMTIPAGVTSIGSYAFYWCDGLTVMELPTGLLTIGSYAFDECEYLTTINIPNTVTTIGESAFAGCTRLTGSLVIPNSVTSLGRYAFSNCSGLNGTLTISENITTIDNYAFSNCSGLTGSLIIPDGVTSIGSYAFNSCSGLDGTIIIGGAVSKIWGGAFNGCSGVTAIISKRATPPTECNEYTFAGITTTIPVYVPDGTTGTYEARTGWSRFTNYIEYDGHIKTSAWSTPSSTDVVCVDNTYSLAGNVTALYVYVPSTSNVLTIPNGYTLTTTKGVGTTQASQLVIEDGGQLVSGFKSYATVKKSIAAATAKDVTNWYAIASSVHDKDQSYESLDNVTNSITGTYDMFYYDEAASKWRNQKAGSGATGFTSMERCRGYIYRNAAAVSLEYTGETNVGTLSDYTLSCGSSNSNLKGFNLIGNPYPHNIYKGVAFATTTDTLVLGYYALQSDGTWLTKTNSDAIGVNQAVLVQVQEAADGKHLEIKDRTAAPAAKANNDKIQFSVKNAQYSDVAYALFDKGVGLNKIDHRNPEIPMLYISQDDGNFAIAMMNDDTKTLNLNFKAMTMGQYTIRAKAEGDFSYMHLIDRLTGTDTDMLLDGEYTFLASPTDSDGRFIVRLDYSAGGETSGDDIFAYQSGDDIIVSGEGELQMFDITGRMVMNATVNGVQTFGKPETAGVYVLRLVGNEMRTQKVVVSR